MRKRKIRKIQKNVRESNGKLKLKMQIKHYPYIWK